MIWLVAAIMLALFDAVADPITIALTALVAGTIGFAGRFVALPWRRAAALEPPADVNHSFVRFILAVATVFCVVLFAPMARQRLGAIGVAWGFVCYGALLIAFAEWLEGQSARLAAWVSFGGMTWYAFLFGANAIGRAAIPAGFDAFACIGFLALAMKAAGDDDRALRSSMTDSASAASA